MAYAFGAKIDFLLVGKGQIWVYKKYAILEANKRDFLVGGVKFELERLNLHSSYRF